MTSVSRARAAGPAAAASIAPDVAELATGWELASAPPGQAEGPRDVDDLEWLPAVIPGTAAAALRAAGRWQSGDPRDFDGEDWWFRVRFGADPAGQNEQLILALDGIATVARVYLNDEPLLGSDSMFASHAVDVTRRLTTDNEIAIRCAALGPLLSTSRQPRARWRTRLVAHRNLRFYRTMLLGRAPGFAAGPAAVGPWKPIRLQRRRDVAVHDLRVRSEFNGRAGKLAVNGRLELLAPSLRLERAAIELAGPSGTHAGALDLHRCGSSLLISGELTLPGVEPWWPHTHGAPALYQASLAFDLDGQHDRLALGRIGFRSISTIGDLERDGLKLEVNGVPVFARGAVWTPPDLARPCSTAAELQPVLEAAVAAGMNMIRVPGTACYEGDAFYDACDELGILVWQDFMFANLDYPDRDADFMDTVGREAREVLGRLGGRPCLAVLCGGSEVAQQAAMMGLDPRIAGGPLYDELLPGAVTEARIQAPYLPSTPWGGDLPFRPDRGVANYYGVGAYLRPLDDARRAEVKFAAECLAFSNVPDDQALEAIARSGEVAVHDPLWKAGVPRDVGAGWDFEDVRDHYLRLLYGVDPAALRAFDHERYLELSRQVTGEVMSEVLGEWRRGDSPCRGALVLWLKDLRPGAGWGLLDHRGATKVVYHHVRRALAPLCVWSTDEGLGGVVAHIANDGGQRVDATLRVAMYRDQEVRVEEVEKDVVLEPHSVSADNVEALLGRFVDASWAYRFGPAAQDVIVLSLERRTDGGRRLLSQTFRFPTGRPTARETADQLGLVATATESADAGGSVIVSSRRLAYGVRLAVPGFVPEDDAFSIEPGRPRAVRLQRTAEPAGGPGYLSAVNLAGRLPIKVGSG